MTDRTPTYPGRVKLVPVSGEINTYDMTRADEPTEAGTPLNKANLLTDATAAKLGLSGNPTVNDALSALGNLVVLSGSYEGDGSHGIDNKTVLKNGNAVVDLTGVTPILLVISPADTARLSLCVVASGRFKIDTGFASGAAVYNIIAPENNALKWYITGATQERASYQFNENGTTYNWLLIGKRGSE